MNSRLKLALAMVAAAALTFLTAPMAHATAAWATAAAGV